MLYSNFTDAGENTANTDYLMQIRDCNTKSFGSGWNDKNGENFYVDAIKHQSFLLSETSLEA